MNIILCLNLLYLLSIIELIYLQNEIQLSNHLLKKKLADTFVSVFKITKCQPIIRPG